MSSPAESVAMTPTKHDGLRHFVNRVTQLALGAQYLTKPATAGILFFHGALGIGKSTLLQRLRTEYCTPAVAYAWLDFQHGELYTADQLIDQLCDQLRDPFSKTMGDELLRLQQAPEQNFQPTLTLQFAPAYAAAMPGGPLQIEATVNVVDNGSAVAIGQNIIQLINSPMNFNGGMVNARHQQEAERGRDRTPQMALTDVTKQQPLLLFCDNIDCASQEVLIWLRNQFLQPIQQGRWQSTYPLIVTLVGDFAGPRGHWLRAIADWHNEQQIYVNDLNFLAAADIDEYWVTHRQLARQTLPASFLELGASPHILVGMADLEMRRHNGHR